MINPDKIFGRLGNRLFEMAALYAFTKERGIDIYCQDYELFDNYKEDIIKMFGTEIGFIPYVGIHVRRGDYLKPPHNTFHTDITNTDYYFKATSLFPDKKFLIFSDDVEYCKSKWPDTDRFQIMEGTELEDFNMLASCEAIIMANSSFSWWASYLNPNHGKRIIAPRETNWFKDGIIRCKLLPEWEQI